MTSKKLTVLARAWMLLVIVTISAQSAHAQTVTVTGNIPYAINLKSSGELNVWTMTQVRDDKDKTVNPNKMDLKKQTIKQKDSQSLIDLLGDSSPSAPETKNYSGTLDMRSAVLPATVAILVDDYAMLTVTETWRPEGVTGPKFSEPYEVKGTALWDTRSYLEFPKPLPPGRIYKLDLTYKNTANLTPQYQGKVDVDGVSVYVCLMPVEIKLRQEIDDTSPTNCRRVYSDSPKNESASNLFSLWPGEGTTIYLKGAFANTVASLPAGTVKWRGTELTPAQDTPEYHVKWTTEGFKAVVLEVAGKEFALMFNIPDVSPRSEAESLEWVRHNANGIVAAKVADATILVWRWSQQSNLIEVKKDALRHYIWSSVLSNTFGLSIASEITGGHENYGKFVNKDPAYLTAMDDYNNAIGAVSAYATGPLLGADNMPLTPDVQIPIFEQAGLQIYAAGSLWIWWPYDAKGNPKMNNGEEGVLRYSDGTHLLNPNQ